MGGTPGPDGAVLVESGLPAPPGAYSFTAASHPAGCLCCALRSGAGDALAALFRARATGKAPFFKTLSVIASATGQAAIRHAIETDVLCQARYRVEE
jgi:hypothetical protein